MLMFMCAVNKPTRYHCCWHTNFDYGHACFQTIPHHQYDGAQCLVNSGSVQIYAQEST